MKMLDLLFKIYKESEGKHNNLLNTTNDIQDNGNQRAQISRSGFYIRNKYSLGMQCYERKVCESESFIDWLCSFTVNSQYCFGNI